MNKAKDPKYSMRFSYYDFNFLTKFSSDF